MLTVNDVEVADLTLAQDWCIENHPETVTIRLAGTLSFPWGVTWTYAAPTVISGNRGIFDGEGNEGTFWLGWRANAHLTLHNITVRGYERGGVDSSSGKLLVDRCSFTNLGSNVCDSDRVGYAAVFVSGISTATVTGTRFSHLSNHDGCHDRHWAWMHAIYARGPRARVSVIGGSFELVSGDPVRVRDGAFAFVTGATSTVSGENALVSSWHAQNERPGAASVAQCKIGKGWHGQPIVPWKP